MGVMHHSSDHLHGDQETSCSWHHSTGQSEHLQRNHRRPALDAVGWTLLHSRQTFLCPSSQVTSTLTQGTRSPAMAPYFHRIYENGRQSPDG